MPFRATTLERAFELARGGYCHNYTEIVLRLKKEGYFDVRAHLDGATIRKQITHIIEARKSLPAAAVQLAPSADA